jgi:unsaturated rhamnogalacturonyl hydrolase
MFSTFIHQEQQRFLGRHSIALTALAMILTSAGCSNGEAPPLTLPDYGEHTGLTQPIDTSPTVPTETAAPPAPAPATIHFIQGSPNAPKPDAVLDSMHLVADWQLDNPSPDDKNSWVNAAFYTGVMALGQLEKDSKYIDAMMAVGADLRWQLDTNIYDADHHAVSQMYLELYALKQESDMIEATTQRFTYIMDFPKDDNLDFAAFGHSDRWSWSDSLFMDPPAWAMLSKVTGDKKYLDSADRRWWVTSDFLYDKDEHLYYRDSRYLTQRETNGQKVFWSRGNGWVIAGLARMLANMPTDYPDRGKFAGQFLEMAERLKSLQQADGLWRSSLLDPADHPQPEASGTGFITYALAWGINHGLLDHDTYAPAVFKAWDALTQCVQPTGKLIHVQPVGDHPNGFDENSSAPFGVGAFLLAGSEVYQLAGGKMPEAPPAAQPAASASTGN